MGPGADLADAESIVAHACGDAVFHSPEHRIVIVAVRGNVGEGTPVWLGACLPKAAQLPSISKPRMPTQCPARKTA